MSEESPTEITKNEQAKWQGIVTGFVSGLILGLKANLQNMAIIGLAIIGGCNYVKNHSTEATLQSVAAHAATKEDVATLQLDAFGVASSNSVAKEISTETNEPTKTP